MSTVEIIVEKHSFTIDGTLFCSWDSVYDDLADLYPHKTHKQICDLMEEVQ